MRHTELRRAEMTQANERELMAIRLDPGVIDQLRKADNPMSYEKIAAKVGRSAHTVRKWHEGKTTPSANDLVKLQIITGRPYGTMLIIDGDTAAVAA